MKCKVTTPFSIRYGEFPELLFGKSEGGIIYFDATLYIELKGDTRKHSPIDFARKFSFWFESFRDGYEISDAGIMIIDEATGHVLMDECLALLFMAYIDPGFGLYMVERVSELLLDGIVLSDSRILQIVRDRLSEDTINQLIEKK